MCSDRRQPAAIMVGTQGIERGAEASTAGLAPSEQGSQKKAEHYELKLQISAQTFKCSFQKLSRQIDALSFRGSEISLTEAAQV